MFTVLPDCFSLLILGLGSTGRAVARWGIAHLGDRVREVTVYGGASSAPSAETAALEAAGARVVYGTEAVAGSYDVCVASPGIPEFSEFFESARVHAAQIMGEPEFAYRLSPERWIGVTGTNGKTTTTSLICHLLHAAGVPAEAVGNIGTTPISAVDDRVAGSWFAAELSSYQLATTSALHPRVAALLNITPDHLAWHRSLEAYAAAKQKIFQNQTAGDLAVICVDDAGAAAAVPAARATGAAVCELSHRDTGAPYAAFLDADGVLTVRFDGVVHRLCASSALHITGEHNCINALAAAAAVLWVGASDADVVRGLTTFSPLEHRIESVATIAGVEYVNDSKATNTDAVEKALTAFPDRPVILLLGGSDKGTPLDSLISSVCISTVRTVVCFGAARERFAQAFTAAREAGSSVAPNGRSPIAPGARAGEADGAHPVEVVEADTLADAVGAAAARAVSGDVVLLSPACASFDEFSGFEERGRRFKALVAEHAARVRS